MQFAQQFQQSRVYEWKSLYIDFKLLFDMLQPFQHLNQQSPASSCKTRSIAYSSGVVNEIDPTIINDLKTLHDSFTKKLKKDIARCDRFFNLHFQQIKIKFRRLVYNIFILQQLAKQKTPIQKNQFLTLREACELLYLEAILLESFAVQNAKAFSKLSKMYRKQVFLSDQHSSADVVKDMWSSTKITEQSGELRDFIHKTKLIYSKSLKSKKDNEKRLKVQHRYIGFSQKENLGNGIFIGLVVCLLLFIVSRRIELKQYLNKEYDLYFPMYRGLGLLILYYWTLILSIYFWQKAHVGYRLIFGFKYHSSTINQLVRRAGFITIVYLIVLIISLTKEIQNEQRKENKEAAKDKFLIDHISDYIYFDPAYGPLLLWAIIAIYMCAPTRRIWNPQGRRYFWTLVYKCLLPFFYPCPFVHHWATDQLISLVVPFKDLAYTFCFYIHFVFYSDTSVEQIECSNVKRIETGLLIGLFPIMLRYLQIGRSIYDAKKCTLDDICVMGIYLEVTLVFLFSYLIAFDQIFLYFWASSCFMLGVTAYYWDLKKDWGLLQDVPKNRYLRRQLAFWPIFYYIAFVLELLLRFSWILSISPHFPEMIGVSNSFYLMIMVSLEICRRTVWNTFRVENVHIQNMGQFRAVIEVQLPFQQYVDPRQYQEWKVLKNQIEDTGYNQPLRNSMPLPELEELLQQQATEDNAHLQDLVEKEQDLMKDQLKEQMYRDRREESVAYKGYSEFRETYHEENSLELLTNQQIRQELKRLNKSIKLQT